MFKSYFVFNFSYVLILVSILFAIGLMVIAMGKIDKSKLRSSFVAFIFNQVAFGTGLTVSKLLHLTYGADENLKVPSNLLRELDKQEWQFIFSHQFWVHLTWCSVYLMPLTSLYFLYIFIGRKVDTAFKMLASVSVMLAVFSLPLEQMVDGGDWSVPLLVFVTTPSILYAISLSAYTWWRTKGRVDSKRNLLVLIGLSFPIVAYLFTEIIGRKIGIPHVSAYALCSYEIVPGTLFFMAMTRYGLLQANLQYAAESLFSSAKDPILLIDQQQNIVRANPTAQQLFQLNSLSREQSIQELVSHFDPQQQRFEATVQIGSEARVFTCSSSNVTTGEEALGQVLLFRDVTRVRELSAMKSEFTSTVSHELRTPLTSIIGFTRIIHKRLDEVILPQTELATKKEERAVKQIRKNLQVVVNEGQRLTQLINDVLDISKMEAGKLYWQFKPIQIAHLITQLLDENHTLITSKDVLFLQNIQADLPSIVADESRIQQVLQNLLKNAFKFTDNGRIQLKVYQQDQEVIFNLKDTGIGIEKENMQNIFFKYQQVGDVLTDKPTGTGLGLPICREIVERHGGKIWVESIVEVGSSFFFSLPITLQNNIKVDVIPLDTILQQWKMLDNAEPARNKSIVIIDDELHIREMLRQTLEVTGYQIIEAADGAEGLEVIRRQRPSLVIVDVMMPKLNGFEVVKSLRNDPRTIKLPIIMLTVIDDMKRGYGLGVDLYLKKPIIPDRIVSGVQSVLEKSKKNATILLLGDPAHSSSELQAVLKKSGQQLHTIPTLDALALSIKSLQPDMILVEANAFSQEEVESILHQQTHISPARVKFVSHT